MAGMLDGIRLGAAAAMGCRCAIGDTPSGPKRVAQLVAAGFRAVGAARPYSDGPFVGIAGTVVYTALPRVPTRDSGTA
jgi:hypothetical protein